MMRSMMTLGLLTSIPLLGAALAEDCAGGEETPAPDEIVLALDGVHQRFGGGDTRTVSAEVTFPSADRSFERILLRYTLECPEGGCDPWDRLAWVTLSEGGAELEVARIITPYGVGGEFEVDVTDLRPLLTGTRTLRSFVDTWVNPGWLVTVSFEFWDGTPEREVLSVAPLYNQWVVYGDPARPVESQLVPTQGAIPPEATGVGVRVLTTGHGQGNADNCAEFCPKTHTVTLGAQGFDEVVWRDDCPETAVRPQGGNWTSPRAGWCPGAAVTPRWVRADAPAGGGALGVGYGVEAYENTCRADHAGGCVDCMSFVTSCDYNGGDHTEPSYRISALLVTYR